MKKGGIVMRILINHSNHPHSKWEEAQREGWDVIIDIPFPTIPPEADTAEVERMAEEGIKAIKDTLKAQSQAETWLCLLGEYTYVYSLYKKLLTDPFVDGLAIPTTERVVLEEDGGKKTSVFRFVRWRLVPLK